MKLSPGREALQYRILSLMLRTPINLQLAGQLLDGSQSAIIHVVNFFQRGVLVSHNRTRVQICPPRWQSRVPHLPRYEEDYLLKTRPLRDTHSRGKASIESGAIRNVWLCPFSSLAKNPLANIGWAVNQYNAPRPRTRSGIERLQRPHE